MAQAGIYGVVLYSIRLLVLVILLGWIFIWIMMPTNTFNQQWFIQLTAKAGTSTYFGSQGTTLLIYTFPILFMASLGCVYLHILKKSNNYDSNKESLKDEKREGISIWKGPVLVKGPFGIVSGTELVFLIMFIALIVWSLATYLHNSFVEITPQSAAQKGLKVWQQKFGNVAYWVCIVGNTCLAFLFFPVTRGSSVLPLIGLTSEGSIKYHIWLGHITMALFTAHGFFFIILWISTNRISQMLKWDKINVSNLAGEISLVSGLLLWVTTIPKIRRKAFELFFYTHYLYIFFVVFFVFHVGFSYTCIMLPGFYLFLVDRFLRFLQSKQQVSLVSARVLPCQTIELNFSKSHGLTYNPTSVMFINIPSISKLQWHPFTISSSSKLEPENLSVVIKSEGSWSQKLYQMLSTSTITRLGVSVEGPYGPASTDYLRHDTLVMMSGGSGITPFISIIRELIHMTKTFKSTAPKIVLIAAFQKTSSLSMLDLILPISGTSLSDISNLDLQIEAYITRDKEFKSDTSISLKTAFFKPDPNDTPVYAILGQNNWLWLGAIISCSFLIFLILIGIITNYYIFPKDHNSDMVFSSSLRSFLNMLVICVSIAIVASAAFLWNKKVSAKEAKQVQNLEGPSPPTLSPNLMIYNSQRDMESVPSQLLAHVTNVHYGVRPDIRKLLSGIKGSSVGVLASGPKKLRHEVASLCSSGLVENMHFESISFSW